MYKLTISKIEMDSQTSKTNFRFAETKKTTEWEKIFPNDMTNKQLISKIYKQYI